MNDDPERIRRDVEQLLQGLRQDLAQQVLTLFREHLAEDATLLAADNPELFRNKEQVLEYLREISQLAKIRWLDAEIESFKRLGDAAVVVERHSAQYEARGKTYRDSGRTTWVLVWDQSRWLVTHTHWESLALNRIADSNL
jgi:hypothetical protein